MEIVFSILPADWASPVGDQVGDTRWPGVVAVRDGLRLQLLVDLHDDLGPSRLVLLLRVRALGFTMTSVRVQNFTVLNRPTRERYNSTTLLLPPLHI